MQTITIISPPSAALEQLRSIKPEKDSTTRAYRERIKHFEVWLDSHNIKPSEATPDDAARFVAERFMEGKVDTQNRRKRVPYSINTLKMTDWALRRFFNQHGYDIDASQDYQMAVQKLQIVDTNKNSAVRHFVRRADILTPEETFQFCAYGMDTNRGSMFGFYAALAMATTARISSMHALDWSDIVETDEGMTVTFRSMKGMKNAIGVPYAVTPWPEQKLLCPVARMRDWRERCRVVDGMLYGPVFRRIVAHDVITSDGLHILSLHRALSAFSKKALPDSNKHITGHSFRRQTAILIRAGEGSIDDAISLTAHKDPKTFVSSYWSGDQRTEAQARAQAAARGGFEKRRVRR